MQTGKIIRFDEVRGYGFIAPDAGGEDVFVHANEFLDEKSVYTQGRLVEFEVAEGERGLKALAVRAVEKDAPFSSETKQITSTPSAPEDDGMCDVLSPVELLQELTEALLEAEPTLTGGQIIAVRQRLLKLARHHGWVEV